MKYFSMPADFKARTLDLYEALNEKCTDSKLTETYGQITKDNIFGSGRMSEALPDIDFQTLEKYVSYSKHKGIQFNYTLNSSCFGNVEFSKSGQAALIEFLKRLSDIGIEHLTVSLPSFIDIIQSSGLDFKIRASTICQINTANKARYYKGLGMDRIVVDENITRDFGALKAICQAFGSGVEIIVNSVCYKDCVFKMFHYNHEAHCAQQSDIQTPRDYYVFKCALQNSDHIRNIIKLNWIRPEDLHHYVQAGIRHFKLQGRHMVRHGNPIKTLDSYFKESFDGNLFNLIMLFTLPDAERYVDNKSLEGFILPFVYQTHVCRRDCDNCKYCDAYLKKSSNPERIKEINEYLTEKMNVNIRRLLKDGLLSIK